MTDTITLPRAVFRKWRNALIEMWVTADTGSRLEIEHILAALDAALAEPDAIARAVEAEREAICPIVYGLCVSDNNAQEIVNAIRARGSDGKTA